jgi:hypothetical protein
MTLPRFKLFSVQRKSAISSLYFIAPELQKVCRKRLPDELSKPKKIYFITKQMEMVTSAKFSIKNLDTGLQEVKIHWYTIN